MEGACLFRILIKVSRQLDGDLDQLVEIVGCDPIPVQGIRVGRNVADEAYRVSSLYHELWDPG